MKALWPESPVETKICSMMRRRMKSPRFVARGMLDCNQPRYLLKFEQLCLSKPIRDCAASPVLPREARLRNLTNSH
ncbi:uncharacterized protein AAG666_014429 isoform 7-T7 [Megaptera novaeangliae]